MKQLRTALGLSQLQLAEYLGTSRSFVAQVETGRRELPIRFLSRLRPLLSWLSEEHPPEKVVAPPVVYQEFQRKEQHLQHQLHQRKHQLKKLEQLHSQQQRLLSLCAAVKQQDTLSRLWANMLEAEMKVQQRTINAHEICWLSYKVKLLELELELIREERLKLERLG